MVQVTTAIELQSSLQANHGGDVVLGHRLRQLLLGHVQVGDVSVMVLACKNCVFILR